MNILLVEDEKPLSEALCKILKKESLLADPAFTEAILNDAPYVKCFSCKGCGWGPGHRHVCPALMKRGDEAWEWA